MRPSSFCPGPDPRGHNCVRWPGRAFRLSARARNFAAVALAMGVPWPGASLASAATDCFAAGQFQVEIHGGPETRCLHRSRSRKELKLRVSTASPVIRDPVTGPEKADMSRGMARGGDALPVRKPRNASFWSEGLRRPGDAGLGRHPGRAPGHQAHQRLDQPPANRVPVLWQVLPRSQRQLAGVHGHRKVPAPRQLKRRAGVIAVRMGQQDRRRARARPEQALRGLLDHLAAVRPRGIDQHPRQPRPHEIDIGPAGGKPEHAGRDFARPAPGTPRPLAGRPGAATTVLRLAAPLIWIASRPPWRPGGQPPRAEGPAVNRRQASPATSLAQAPPGSRG